MQIAAGDTEIVSLRLSAESHQQPFDSFDQQFADRRAEADEFYSHIHGEHLTEDQQTVQRQALAGMLWSKQLFYYDIEQWLAGDPISPPPGQRKSGRNHDWQHLNNFDIIPMPDKWEYPWYAGWDLAFHCIPLALVDPDFAKDQLLLLTREWYMHPNGQLPAYEWALGDVNSPVANPSARKRVLISLIASSGNPLKNGSCPRIFSLRWMVQISDSISVVSMGVFLLLVMIDHSSKPNRLNECAIYLNRYTMSAAFPGHAEAARCY
jgi:hypothetical protein